MEELFDRTKLAVVIAGIALVAGAKTMVAHHSFAAEFDASKTFKMTGPVTKVEWMNPHIWFFVDVTDEAGKVTNWGFSGGAPGILQRRGIRRDSMKVGDVVVVEGFRARDGSNNASGGRVTFADGSQVFTASPGDRTPGQ